MFIYMFIFMYICIDVCMRVMWCNVMQCNVMQFSVCMHFLTMTPCSIIAVEIHIIHGWVSFHLNPLKIVDIFFPGIHGWLYLHLYIYAYMCCPRVNQHIDVETGLFMDDYLSNMVNAHIYVSLQEIVYIHIYICIYRDFDSIKQSGGWDFSSGFR